ncbi:hypothetical protein [Tropicimonas marinistellae]|uniref:hypothetical protein n=1 Tax=Tropicimonas marinistellae TaxID=1739787 RepID=UPI000832035A|nr:hypothetical protein [Tropicimonas marinistellae]
MNEIADLEGRISAAMARIATAVERFEGDGTGSADALDHARRAAETAEAEARAALARAESAEAEVARLTQALEAESDAGGQLRERVGTLKSMKERQQERIAELEAELKAIAGLRTADREELDGLISSLAPLVEGQSDA